MGKITSGISNAAAIQQSDIGAGSSQSVQPEANSSSPKRSRASNANLPSRVGSSQSPKQAGNLTAEQLKTQPKPLTSLPKLPKPLEDLGNLTAEKLKAQAEEFVSHSKLPKSLEDLAVQDNAVPTLAERLESIKNLDPTQLTSLPELPENLQKLRSPQLTSLPPLPENLAKLTVKYPPEN